MLQDHARRNSFNWINHSYSISNYFDDYDVTMTIGSVYKENIRKSIKTQLNWANAEEGDARIEFLDYIINYCERLKRSGNKKSKPKTRHGAGGKAATKEVT